MRIIEENEKFALVADTGMSIKFGDNYCHKLYRKENNFSDCTEVSESEVPILDSEVTEADYIAEFNRLGVEL